eukprot:CAMPEP_0116544552 /NCGR_PEP_ID=MMETSP0397-20121206/2179_1 /TAXON_ID=216820 /ORGANISM="Cyclophora tenuis, Strain ECT3854" /LENGTH=34 /DNA_ID= /DNA_START= /DNA_END= /DNA_ORIENTATION=
MATVEAFRDDVVMARQMGPALVTGVNLGTIQIDH